MAFKRNGPGCCCGGTPPVCDIDITLTPARFNVFNPGTPKISYAVVNTGGSENLDVVVQKNGSTVATFTDVASVSDSEDSLVAGDVITVTANFHDDTSCQETASCTYYGAYDDLAGQTCRVWDAGVEGYLDDEGDCINGEEINDLHERDTTSHQVTVSGFTGVLAPLNATYTVSCTAQIATTCINYGTADGATKTYNSCRVRLRWLGDNNAELTIVSRHSNVLGSGADCGGTVTTPDPNLDTVEQESTKTPVSDSRSGVSVHFFSCESCSGSVTLNWTTGNTEVDSSSGTCAGLGPCAADGSYVWNY